ncbi:MAG: hypothetical protein O3A92_12980 [Verrucomicrobia bacterium]|nr:hypothetical protein [Verrucomicrobiota bacterium]
MDELGEALALLGEVLEGRKAPPVHLVVCGGAALRARGIVGRVTKDVDVLARRGEVDGELMTAWPLPDVVKEAAAEVATEMRLPTNWLNASTSMMMVPLGDLPAELWSEIQEEEFGRCLRIGFVGRVGQIHLKMYAAIGRVAKRDVDDLVALAPTAEECGRVVNWLRACGLLDGVGEKRLAEVLKEVGHG